MGNRSALVTAPAHLYAETDLRKIRSGEWIWYGLGSLLKAGTGINWDVSSARALSNLIEAQWPEHGLSGRSWWIPRKQDARQLFGSRALAVGGAAADGGSLAGQSAVMRLAAATRPLLTLQQAGAQVHEVGGLVDALIPEWDPTTGTGYWVNEGAAVGAANLAIRSGTASPHTVGTQQTISRRLALQAVEVESQLLREMARVVAVTAETGVWQGTGTDGQPHGILSTPDAQSVSFAAEWPTYAELVEMFEAYVDNNGDPSAMTFFCHPRVLSKMMTTEVASGTGQFAAACIHGPRTVSVFGVPVYPTQCIPFGPVVLCDPRDLHIIYWRAPSLSINPYNTNGDLQYVVLNDLDVVVTHRHTLVIGSN